jgi:hypothetical protein
MVRELKRYGNRWMSCEPAKGWFAEKGWGWWRHWRPANVIAEMEADARVGTWWKEVQVPGRLRHRYR